MDITVRLLRCGPRMLVMKSGLLEPSAGAYAETRRVGLPPTKVVTTVTRPHLEPVSDFVTLASAWSADSSGFRSMESRGITMAVPWPLPPGPLIGAYRASHRTR